MATDTERSQPEKLPGKWLLEKELRRSYSDGPQNLGQHVTPDTWLKLPTLAPVDTKVSRRHQVKGATKEETRKPTAQRDLPEPTVNWARLGEARTLARSKLGFWEAGLCTGDGPGPGRGRPSHYSPKSLVWGPRPGRLPAPLLLPAEAVFPRK